MDTVNTTDTVVTDPPKKRFDFVRALKISALALTGVGLLVLLKRKLNSSVDGQVNVTVETTDPS